MYATSKRLLDEMACDLSWVANVRNEANFRRYAIQTKARMYAGIRSAPDTKSNENCERLDVGIAMCYASKTALKLRKLSVARNMSGEISELCK